MTFILIRDFYTHNGDHLNLLIKTDDFHENAMLLQSISHSVEKCN